MVVVVVGDEEPAPKSGEVGVVVGGEAVVVVVVGANVVEVVGACGGALDADAPGCSLATTMPRTTVAPVAATAANRVRKRRDAAARRRLSGE